MFLAPPERSAPQIYRITESLWRGVEEPVLSEAEGTSAMLVSRCSSELSGHKLWGKSKIRGKARNLQLDGPSWNFFEELSWSSGPPKVMKNASVRQPLSIEPLPFPLSSRAQTRDLRFYGPSVEMFVDRAERSAVSLNLSPMPRSTRRLPTKFPRNAIRGNLY